jgi:hypothetical protein
LPDRIATIYHSAHGEEHRTSSRMPAE